MAATMDSCSDLDIKKESTASKEFTGLPHSEKVSPKTSKTDNPNSEMAVYTDSCLKVEIKNENTKERTDIEGDVLAHEKTSSSSTDTGVAQEMVLLQRCLQEFNRDRKIIIRNIPPCSYEQVKELMNGHGICNISISKKSRHAVVTLLNGDKAVEIASELDKQCLLGTKVSVSFYPSDRLLCLSHLPDNFTENDFQELVSKFGPVSKYFLMRDSTTGESQGYGFVEYCVNRDRSQPIQDNLDSIVINDSELQCDFVPPNQAHYEDLRSRCLLIENLPENYKDSCNLREISSVYSNPVYCRILLNDDGSSLRLGIVEYSDHDIATKTRRNLNGSGIIGAPLRVSFCLVGKNAIEIYNRLISKKNNHMGKGSGHKSSLLPNPILPNENLMNSPLMKSLTNRQPHLTTRLRSALTELQSNYSQQFSKSNKQGLLGPAPTPMNPLLNPNLQLGLTAMLALQLHRQNGSLDNRISNTDQNFNVLSLLDPTLSQGSSKVNKPSLLGDPSTAQARILVQNLMSQLQQNTRMGSGTSDNNPNHDSSESQLPWQHDNLEQNVKNLNINLLANLGQTILTLQQNLPKPPLSNNFPEHNKARRSLLGDAPGVYGKQKTNETFNPFNQSAQPHFYGPSAGESKENFLRNVQNMTSQFDVSRGRFGGQENNNGVTMTTSSKNSTFKKSLLGDFPSAPPSTGPGPTQGYNNNNDAHNQRPHPSMNRLPPLLPDPVSNQNSFNNNNNNAFGTTTQFATMNDNNQSSNGILSKPPPLLPDPYTTCQNNFNNNQPSTSITKQKPLLPDPLTNQSVFNNNAPLFSNPPPSSSYQPEFKNAVSLSNPPPLLQEPHSRQPNNNNNNSMFSQHPFQLPVSSQPSVNISKQKPLLPNPFTNQSSMVEESYKKTSLLGDPPSMAAGFHGNQSTSSNFSSSQPLLPTPMVQANQTVPTSFSSSQPLLPNPMVQSNQMNAASFTSSQPLLPNPVIQSNQTNPSTFPSSQPLLPNPISQSNQTNPSTFSSSQPLLPNPIIQSNQTNSSTFSSSQPLLPNPVTQSNQMNPSFSSSKPLLPNPIIQSNQTFNISIPSKGLLPNPSYQSLHRSNHLQSPSTLSRGYPGVIGSKPALLATPVGNKRSYSSLFPAPEASPDGDYIGQHSQGIGGHYAETHRSKYPRTNNWQQKSLFSS